MVELKSRLRAAFSLGRYDRCWHFSDMAAALSDVRCWRQSRKHLLAASISPFDPSAPSETLHLAPARAVSGYLI
jgi:hypothetical protein